MQPIDTAQVIYFAIVWACGSTVTFFRIVRDNSIRSWDRRFGACCCGGALAVCLVGLAVKFGWCDREDVVSGALIACACGLGGKKLENAFNSLVLTYVKSRFPNKDD